MFRDNDRRESVYRGSTRLSPLFKEMQQQKLKKTGVITQRRGNFNVNRNTPYVEYTRHADNENINIKRAVAKKSTGGIQQRRADPAVPQIKWEYRGDLYKTELKEKVTPRKFTKHQCGPGCVLDENKYDEKVSFLK